MARWGLTEFRGPEKILEHIEKSNQVNSVLFVGAAHQVDYIPIIRQIQNVNHRCKVIFSDQYMISPNEVGKIKIAGGEFLQIDVLQDPESDFNVDCIIAFGLFSPQVIWANTAKIALCNLIKMTREGGLIVASTREQYDSEFEEVIKSVDSILSFEKSTDYDQDTAYDKHAFGKGWKEPYLGRYYPGFEDYNNLIDAYRAYLNSRVRRTNFYIQKRTN